MSPNIDRLAEKGVQFSRAYCQVAVCNPSRASLMTGLRPDKLGVWTLPIHFREAKPDAVTIPQWFRKHGYTAVSHGKIFHNPTPDPQSWSEPIRKLPKLPYHYPEGTRDVIKAAQEALPQDDWRKNNLRGPSTAAPLLDDSQVLDGARTDMAIEDLKRLGKLSDDQPFFLAMGYIRPHLAWVAPKRYWDLYEPQTLPIVRDQFITPGTPQYALHNNSELTHYVDLIDHPKPWDENEVDETTARRLMHGYYACVSFIDAQIGRLIRTLEEEGLADNTIIVLWSDHGWKLGEHRGWGKMTNYEIDARVPLLICDPQLKSSAGQTTEHFAELLDLFPTLCDLAKIEKPEFVDGVSLMPTLADSKEPSRTSATNQYYRKSDGEEYMGYSIRTDAYRLIEWRDFSTGEVVASELYDHRVDPRELKNVFDSTSDEIVQGLIAQLLVTHPRVELQMTPAVHSSPSRGRWKSDIEFVNQSNTEINVIPITPAGRRGKSKSVQPGAKLRISARIGGVYVVESVDGKIHQIHSPSFPTRPIVIDHE
ncbi:MAG: sulfatase [Aureliella sp.]